MDKLTVYDPISAHFVDISYHPTANANIRIRISFFPTYTNTHTYTSLLFVKLICCLIVLWGGTVNKNSTDDHICRSKDLEQRGRTRVVLNARGVPILDRF